MRRDKITSLDIYHRTDQSEPAMDSTQCVQGGQAHVGNRYQKAQHCHPIQLVLFDSLIYCRQSIPKMPSYTLSDLYRSLFHKGIPNLHSVSWRSVERYTYLLEQYEIEGSYLPCLCYEPTVY